MLCFFSRPSDPNARGRQPYAHFGSRTLHVLSQQGPQPNHCSHGVGCAWGSKLLGDGSVSVIAFGDGGAQKGEVHESMNVAAIHRLPCIFVVHRNGWTQSVKRERPVRDRDAGRARRGLRHAGDRASTAPTSRRCTRRRARRSTRARNGGGPTLIDARVRALHAEHVERRRHALPRPRRARDALRAGARSAAARAGAGRRAPSPHASTPRTRPPPTRRPSGPKRSRSAIRRPCGSTRMRELSR